MLDIYKFGEALINTRDLDPLYVGLVGAQLPKDQLYRYLLAYWCFYHTGVSAWLSELEGKDYFWAMEAAAANFPDNRPCDMPRTPQFNSWPRGSERRHFRGQKCVNAVQRLAATFKDGSDAVQSLLKKRGDMVIMETVKQWPMFGDWIAFKVVDMLERCAGVNCQISPDLVLMYDEPAKALNLLVTAGNVDASEVDYWNALLKHFSKFKAPPDMKRACGPTEAETVCCKWKSYMGGHYWIGKDIKEHREALHGWGETAQKIASFYPAEIKRDNQHSGNERVREEHHSARPAGRLF